MQSILDEIAAAEAKYGPFTSTHEALGVITEEYHELVEAIRGNNWAEVMQEAIQLAACAARLSRQCNLVSNDQYAGFWQRSGL